MAILEQFGLKQTVDATVLKLYTKYKINQLFPEQKCNIKNHICTENETDEFVMAVYEKKTRIPKLFRQLNPFDLKYLLEVCAEIFS